MAALTSREAVRIAGLCAQADMALVRRDPVSAALLAQAARAAAGLPGGEVLAVAASTVRTVDVNDRAPGPAACRKAVQALCRIAAQEAQAALLAPR